jgi:hypothetical protein
MRGGRGAVLRAVFGALVLTAVIAALIVALLRPGSGLARTTPRPVAADSPLPGLARIASLAIPDDIQVISDSEDRGQVWAVGSAPGSQNCVVMHGHEGGTFAPVTRLPGADVVVVVQGAHAFVVSGPGYDDGGSAQPPVLREYDARTGGLQDLVRLDRVYGADGATMKVTDGLVLLALTAHAPDGTQTLRVGVIDDRGRVVGLTSPARVPPGALETLQSGARVSVPAGVALITVAGGAPQYAFLADALSHTTPRVDLRTGVVESISVVPPGTRHAGTGFFPEGEFGDRLFFPVGFGVVAGSPTSLTTYAALGDPGAMSHDGPTSQLVIVAGRAYLSTDDGDHTRVRQLNAATLQAFGPTAMTTDPQVQGSYQALYLGTDGTSAAVARDTHDENNTQVGGTFVVYAPG